MDNPTSKTHNSPAQTNVDKRTFWTEFFALYESLPALWDLNNPLYKDRLSKARCYEMLVYKMREIDPHACREDVLRKINIFRTNYRRECARIKASKQIGKQYKTSLWYFHMLHFLQNQEFRKERKRTPDQEKAILRRAGTKTQTTSLSLIATQGISKTPLSLATTSQHAHNILRYNEKESEPPKTTKYEYDADNDTCAADTEEHLEQYADEHTFQQQFHTFHHNSKLNIKESVEEEEFIDDTVEADADAEYQEIINNNNDEAQEQDGGAEMVEELEDVDEIDIKHMARCESNSTGHEEFTDQPLMKVYKSTITPITGTTTMAKKSKSLLSLDTHTNEVQKPRFGGAALSETSEILARSWAIQYEEMSVEQRIYARKAIAEILFEGCLGNLGSRRHNRVATAEAVESSQYEQTVSVGTLEQHQHAADNIVDENVIHLEDDDDDSHAYVYTSHHS